MTRLPRILYAVPHTLHARLEIANAIGVLNEGTQEEHLRRRADLAALRRDCEDLSKAVSCVIDGWNSQYASESVRTLNKAAVDDPKHPGWPAGAPGGLGGKFQPKDRDGSAVETAATGVQYAASDANRDQANDNLTAEQTCRRAYSDAVTLAQLDPALSPADYLKVRRESAVSLDDCLQLASGDLPISRNGDFVFFHGGGIVIFRRDRPPIYVRPPVRQ